MPVPMPVPILSMPDGGTRVSLSALLASRQLLAVVPFGGGLDLRTPPDGVAVASLDQETAVSLNDDNRELLAHWLRRTDRVFVFDEARPALRRLLAVGIDVARPICRTTLESLSGTRVEEGGHIAPGLDVARHRAGELVRGLEELLQRVEDRGHKKVARLECLVLRAFAALEHRGLPIDVPGWRLLVEEETQKAEAARARVFEAAGAHVARDLFGTPEINLDAEQEVRALLRRALGADLDDVSRGTLAQIDHPLARALLDFRESWKVVSTYGQAFLDRVDRRTGRIHATFVPLGASTGRVASRDPNLQNLPSDPRFHRCLRAPEGSRLVTADYATCELRIVAELALDPVFLEAFARGEDLHATVATQMFGDKVSKTERPELRQRAKAINFGLVYGMGPQALASSLGVDRAVAEELLARYFKTFPKIRDYLEDSVDVALQRGYSETLLGRRLYFAAEQLRGDNARGELSRIMKNMPIQGSSADMTKLAMVRVHERLLDETKGSAGLVNTVHDELVVECSEADGTRVADIVRQEMEAAHRTLLKRVPPLVEVHVAEHWQH